MTEADRATVRSGQASVRPCVICSNLNNAGVDFELSRFFSVRICRDCGRGIANLVLLKDPPPTMRAWDRNVEDQNGDPKGSVGDAIERDLDLLDPRRMISPKWGFQAEWKE